MCPIFDICFEKKILLRVRKYLARILCILQRCPFIKPMTPDSPRYQCSTAQIIESFDILTLRMISGHELSYNYTIASQPESGLLAHEMLRRWIGGARTPKGRNTA